MLLCLDIGNTSIVVAEYDKEIINSFRLDTNSNICVEDFKKNLQSDSFEDVIVSSVVPSLNNKIKNIIFSFSFFFTFYSKY